MPSPERTPGRLKRRFAPNTKAALSLLSITIIIVHVYPSTVYYIGTDQCLFVIDLSIGDWPSSRVHCSDGRVFVMVHFQPMWQFVHDVPEHDRIDVVAEHVQQHPVAQLRPADNVPDGLPFDQAEPYTKQIHAHPRGHYDNKPRKKQKREKQRLLKIFWTFDV